ncbi:hypothetical protein QYF36_019023 [Acer negundo]|nr:hypothetical protein QYF36_019023 [Acer negundo]
MLLLEMFIIDRYVKNGCAVDDLRCFMEMRSVGVGVDAMMIVSVLVAARIVGDVWFGRWVKPNQSTLTGVLSAFAVRLGLFELKLNGYVSDKDFLVFDLDVA